MGQVRLGVASSLLYDFAPAPSLDLEQEACSPDVLLTKRASKSVACLSTSGSGGGNAVPET